MNTYIYMYIYIHIQLYITRVGVQGLLGGWGATPNQVPGSALVSKQGPEHPASFKKKFGFIGRSNSSLGELLPAGLNLILSILKSLPHLVQGPRPLGTEDALIPLPPAARLFLINSAATAITGHMLILIHHYITNINSIIGV